MRIALKQLWMTRRAKRIAVSLIAPLVEHSRNRQNFDDRIWLDPYFLGFMLMLITYIVKRKVESIDSCSLAIVQSEAWEEITTLDGVLVGEESICLSTSRDQLFEFGCRNAILLGQELCTMVPADFAAYGDVWSRASSENSWIAEDNSSGFAVLYHEDENVRILWEAMFEGQIHAVA